MDAVWDVIHSIFGPDTPPRIATHELMPRETYRSLSQYDVGLVGGTNILKSHMFVRANWRLRPYDMFFLKNVVLLGVGWQQYQGAVDIFSRALFKCILSNKFMHSVRDEYTLDQMRGQVKSVAYTACPTLWSLTEQKCAAVPTRKAKSAIVSLTYYRPDPADAELIRMLLREYETVHFWCQMEKDRDYLNAMSLGVQIPVIADVESYNRLLETGRRRCHRYAVAWGNTGTAVRLPRTDPAQSTIVRSSWQRKPIFRSSIGGILVRLKIGLGVHLRFRSLCHGMPSTPGRVSSAAFG